ncbi:hypothetical protein OOZ51_02595 [Arthrobacter sp. MI7-26]|uniref:hypothetical protein n=1 Tax=Arthrobacter sp. MI7-26 TaxID=2993653 RepID=UPI0022490E8A|nr:hypothetical protein [Arthrobacter sp. MI7-26]MCX2746701.1 hypothetical protein [Arthrobacter sp. MI7-26]
MAFDYAQTLRDAQSLITESLLNGNAAELYAQLLSEQQPEHRAEWCQLVNEYNLGLMRPIMDNLCGGRERAITQWQAQLASNGADTGAAEALQWLQSEEDDRPGE